MNAVGFVDYVVTCLGLSENLTTVRAVTRSVRERNC